MFDRAKFFININFSVNSFFFRCVNVCETGTHWLSLGSTYYFVRFNFSY